MYNPPSVASAAASQQPLTICWSEETFESSSANCGWCGEVGCRCFWATAPYAESLYGVVMGYPSTQFNPYIMPQYSLTQAPTGLHATELQSLDNDDVAATLHHSKASTPTPSVANSQVDSSTCTIDYPVSFGHPIIVGDSVERCKELINELADPDTEADVLAWVFFHALPLSSTRGGCRLVQGALEKASARQKDSLAEKLLPHTMQLYTSPNANFVLAKFIEIMPTSKVAQIADTIRGKVAQVARHRFGCRILERLIEHGSETNVGMMLDEIQVDTETLARHQYGNFVIQHILEHASESRKHAIMLVLLQNVLQHISHRTASHVVQCFLEKADKAWQGAIVDVLLSASGDESLENIAALRYGSFVVRQLLDRNYPSRDLLRARMFAACEQLQSSVYGHKNIVSYFSDELGTP